MKIWCRDIRSKYRKDKYMVLLIAGAQCDAIVIINSILIYTTHCGIIRYLRFVAVA